MKEDMRMMAMMRRIYGGDTRSLYIDLIGGYIILIDMWKELISASPIYDLFGKRSYSQCGEDLVLWHILNQENGFYVDIGAYHPKKLSNTYLLYKRGWRGVTIEPNPDVTWLFELTRGRDEHWSCGLARKAGEMKYREFSDRTRNTFDEAQVKLYREAGYQVVGERQVRVKSVKSLMSRLRGQMIDVLSVDCEGMDGEILRAWDFELIKPKVVVVEDGDLAKFLSKLGYRRVAELPFSSVFVCDTMLVA
jgi:FkbM family methyltransferase